MTVEVVVHDDAVDIDFSGWNRVWSLKQHLRLGMYDIIDARVVPQSEVKKHLGVRMLGTWVPGAVTSGRYFSRGRKGARQIWDTYRDPEVLLIETKLDDPWRVVLQHPDRERLAWLIAERIQH